MQGIRKKFFYQMLIIFVVCVLAIIAFMGIMYRSTTDLGGMIATDIVTLKAILEEIDKTCKIINFDYQQNWINFLHIKKDGFTGSEVGSVNLAYPEKWNGPYLQDNLEIQEIEYMVVRTKQGYFITPGQGVKLPNGKVIGKDIILDEGADIQAMMQDSQMLNYQGKSLAAPLMIGTLMRREKVKELLPED